MAEATQWMCTYCGTKTTSFEHPNPTSCTRRGVGKPHSWVKNPIRKEAVLWMCKICGTRTSDYRRPMPGICSKKQDNKPHSWIKC